MRLPVIRNRLKKFIAMGLVVTVCFVFLEFVARFLFEKEYAALWGERVMLFSEGENFRNVEDFFTYHPYQTILSETFYADPSTSHIEREYIYTINTNNAGLVQKNDLIKRRPSIFILGDSYTEGQGASPWFYDFEQSWKNKDWQLINGGILGTGIKQFSRLLAHVEKEYDINELRVVLVFISNDFFRPQWSFSDQQIACLKASESCVGEEGYYGFSFKPGSSSEQYAREIYKDRSTYGYLKVALKYYEQGNYWDAFKSLLKVSTLLKVFYVKLVSYDFSANGETDNINFKALEALIKRFDSRISFVHIWQKDESILNEINEQGEQVRSFFEQNAKSARITECRLSPEDYHSNDSHPNRLGYTKVRECVNLAAAKLASEVGL